MNHQEAPIKGVFIIEPKAISDDRGYFSRTYCKHEFEALGFHGDWVQINHSQNRKAGTFRGFHFQLPPKEETKLVRCVSGAILDFVVDLRKDSHTFLKTFHAELSAENRKLILIPPGVGHAFLTTEENTGVIYHHSQFYDKDLERGVRHDDPLLRLQLPFPIQVISERDKSHASLPAKYEGIAL